MGTLYGVSLKLTGQEALTNERYKLADLPQQQGLTLKSKYQEGSRAGKCNGSSEAKQDSGFQETRLYPQFCCLDKPFSLNALLLPPYVVRITLQSSSVRGFEVSW